MTFVVAAGYRVAAGQAAPQDAAVNGVGPQALAQISQLLAEKAALTPTQLKIDSRLLHAKRRLTGETRVPFDVALARAADGRVQLELRADVTDRLLTALDGLGVNVLTTQASGRSVLIDAELLLIEQIAALPDVYFVQPRPDMTTNASRGGLSFRSSIDRDVDVATRRERKVRARGPLIASVRAALSDQQVITNVGSANSQGDVTHKAATARATLGVSGAGISVGVISDGVTSLAASQGLGDLGPVAVLAGQAGSGDEGTAMLEIVHDVAPNAQLFFATALNTPAQFAQNIRDLRTAGCDIIVDDVGYFVETAFQDGQAPAVISPTNGGVIAQAVKDVTAAGALYFSSAANSGSKDLGTSGTWEGDFVDGGDAGPPISSFEPGRLHLFGGLAYDQVTANTGPVTLHWTDPLGASANDYDIFILDSAGTIVFDAATGVQNGTQDPYERTGGAFTNERIVIVKFAGAGRFLHLDTNRGRLANSTAGSTHGHATTTSPTSFSVAATPVATRFGGVIPPGPYPNPFNSTNTIEPFSSDGPRQIFFTSTGAPITPGNVSSSGGQILQKPDLTAADGVSVTGAGGFPNPFYGTSASAPHVAAIAALVKSAVPGVTAAQVRAALIASAIDIHAPGLDRDSGYGIVMADTAICAVAVPTIATPPAASQTIPANTTTSVSVAANGLAALAYQWHEGLTGVVNPIGGATSSTFVTPPLNGQTNYWVNVSNACGSVASSTAKVSVTFTDPHSTIQTLTTGSTIVAAAHIVELRNRINARRALAGQPPLTWSEPLMPHSTLIKTTHVNELRNAITNLYILLVLPAPTFSGPDPLNVGLFVRAQHIAELRALMTAVE